MKWIVLFLSVLFAVNLPAQDFTNKGKEFWLCFPSHIPNQRDGVFFYAKMSVFISSDNASSGIVSIPGIFNSSFSVTPGVVTEIDIPYGQAHINASEAGTVIKKGINVLVDSGKNAVVVYAHIYAGFRSAASLILPARALGKKYYSMNALQNGIDNSKSQFVVVAVAANTVVKITPVKNAVASAAFTVSLPLAGDVYEMQDDKDLSGSIIESIASGIDVCKKIAVFSGSSAINIATNSSCVTNDSYDPLYQQLYPVNVWGKKYGFIPFKNYSSGNPFRVLASENGTTVKINGANVAILNSGEYFPANNSFGSNLIKTAGFIEADKPVSVAQYAQSSACSGATPPPGKGYGDADMVLLNPVEQNANNITVFSSQKENIYADAKFINVLIPEKAAASFKINNTAQAVIWSPVLPAGSGYSYASINLGVNQNAFSLSADSSFNAIAYGFGDYESYAYSAGTNVKDLYRTVLIQNEFGDAAIIASCKNTRFKIIVTYPYRTDKIVWKFKGLFTDETINNPVPSDSFFINDKKIYRYKLDKDYQINNAGDYTFSVVANNRVLENCQGDDEIEFNLQILDRPKADFNFLNNGCVIDSIQFTNTSNTRGRAVSKWLWAFGDNSISVNKSPNYQYAAPKQYLVSHWLINDIGCVSDTAMKAVKVTNTPVAGFSMAASSCQFSSVSFNDQSIISGSDSITKWSWKFGDNTSQENNNNLSLSHIYKLPGVYNIVLQVQSESGCKSNLFQQAIKINPKPVTDFSIPVFCLPLKNQFINKSSISDSSESLLQFKWDFGDGEKDSLNKDPYHQYVTKAVYQAKLIATSKDGCKSDTTKTINSIVAQANIEADAPLENCLFDTTYLKIKGASADGVLFNSFFISSNIDSSFYSNNINPGQLFFTKQLLFSHPGSQQIRVFGKSAATGCFSDTVIKTLYINQFPVVEFAVASPICVGRKIQFFDSTKSADGSVNKWKWDLGNGASSALKNPENIYQAGTYTIKLSAETNKGCKGLQVSKTIKVNPVPKPDFTFPEVCLKEPVVQFSNFSSIADEQNNRLLYLWKFNDLKSNVPERDTSSLRNPTHMFSDTGEYRIRLTVTSEAGCEADTIKYFTINGTRPFADFSTEDSTRLCSNKSITIKNLSSVDFGVIGKMEIFWDSKSDSTLKLIDENPSREKKYDFKYPDVSGSEKEYQIKLVAYSGITCKDTITRLISLKPVPLLRFDSIGKICENASPVSFSAKAFEINQLKGSGAFQGKGANSSGFFDPKQAGVGNHFIQYIFISNDGCINSTNQSVQVLPSPLVNAGNDKSIFEGNQIALNGSGNGVIFNWTPMVDINNSNIATPIVSPKNDIIYKLTITSTDGCTAFDEVTVKVIKKVIVPNAFTPNGDGLNDKWGIPYLENYKDAVVQVFDRFGKKIFYSKGYRFPWDGTYNGEPLSTGTYCWTISLGLNQNLLSGFVTLIR